jgi:predicted DNA-binding transcriptional regulator YafY
MPREGLKRLERLLAVALLLSARRRLKAEELSSHFRVSLRTVYRDLRALQDTGFPVTGTPGDGYVLPAASQLRPLALDPGEAEALVIGARLLERSADEALRHRLQTALAKLEAVLPVASVRRVRDSRRSVVMPETTRPQSGPLSLLLEAVGARQVVEIRYDGVARGETTLREMEPLGLVRLEELWLVPAYCRLRQDLRVFRADRVLEARLTGETFAPRAGLTLEDFVRRERDAPVPARRSS